MFGAASVLGNRYTDAACTLLAGPWRNDPVMFVGDYFTPPKTGCPFNIEVHHYRYAPNKTRHEFVDRDQGPISARAKRRGRGADRAIWQARRAGVTAKAHGTRPDCRHAPKAHMNQSYFRSTLLLNYDSR